MSQVKGFLAAVLVLALGACTTTYIQDQLNPIRSMQTSGSAFTQALHSEYLWLADAEYAGNDLSDALYYGEKARRAGNGEEVAPEDPTAQGMPSSEAAEMTRAHARLMAALEGGGKTAAPAAMARAQVAFDCMVREWCEIHDAIAGCRDRFWAALAEVEAALMPMMEPPARDYLIFFDWNKSDVRNDASKVLDEVVSAMRALNATKVNLIGFTDTSGAASYNQILSVRRASSAKEYLELRGVNANAIMTSGRGENDLLVPTPDGVREEENRRVEITLE
ncbi:MAG: OmpA family protein [Rhodospirillaceae bacterium]|jgi:OmpA-OmpF porin, OOP family|nr:OmpA family protein [Rhodospirillaceae bacterium]